MKKKPITSRDKALHDITKGDERLVIDLLDGPRDHRAITDIIKGPKSHGLSPERYMQKLAGVEGLPEKTLNEVVREKEARDFASTRLVGTKKSDCCDGTVLEFPFADVCVSPQHFMEIAKFQGNTICAQTSDASLPNKLTVIVTEPSNRTAYYNRSIFPGWFRSLADSMAKDDPENRKMHKKAWEKITKAAMKKTLKKLKAF